MLLFFVLLGSVRVRMLPIFMLSMQKQCATRCVIFYSVYYLLGI